MKTAHISIVNFGDTAETVELAQYLAATTPWVIQQQPIVLAVPVAHLGAFFARVATEEKLNWIEYTVQFAD